MITAEQTAFIKRAMDAAANGGVFRAGAMDAATAGGLAFLQSELEKLDPKVREPLHSETWDRDIVAKTGGGFVDFTSNLFVDYGTTGPNMYGLMGGQTNNIPIMQADMSKDVFPVFGWNNIMKVPYGDMMKIQNAGRSLEDLLNRGVRLNWNKAIDQVVYAGFGTQTGLLNNTTISHVATAKTWSDPLKTPIDVLNDINGALIATWAASEYDITGMANHILIPPTQYGLLTQPMTISGCNSIMEYVLKNNIGKQQGVDVKIFPSRRCIGAGTGGTDRMIAYVNEEDKLVIDITVPITRAMTAPDVKEAAYLTLYVGQLGVVKFLYTQTATYVDAI